MRPQAEYDEAIRLVGAGFNDSEISRRLNIPRGTIRDWRHAAEKNPGYRTVHATGHRPNLVVTSTNPGGRCDGTCEAPVFALRDRNAYFYLLGQYLGDGTISEMSRGVYRLRVTCDQRYRGIISEVDRAARRVSGRRSTSIVQRTGCVDLAQSWKHWACVFPQHGSGRKHERPIHLSSWQLPASVADHQRLIRGLLHSDGCRFINPVVRHGKDGTVRYEYVRYVLTNASSDIRTIFTESLDALGIQWRQMNARNISVARRESVVALDQFVGPKY